MHIVHRGVDRRAVFLDDEDRLRYLVDIECGARRHGVLVHGYVLMTNHVHLLVSAEAAGAVSRMVQGAVGRYVRRFNRRYERTGTLWERRFWSGLVDRDRSVLACLAYIELNPVRAGMVASATDWRWSSARHHLAMRADSLVTSHAVFVAIAAGRRDRADRWREMLERTMRPAAVRRLRAQLYEGFAFGSTSFRESIQTACGIAWKPAAAGRPRCCFADAEPQ